MKLISASIFASLSEGAPEEIVYLPEGIHEITPTVNGKPGKVTVRVPAEKGTAIAAALQASLERRLADNVVPIIDFDHQHRGPSAGRPKSFRYETGRGVVMALDWSNAGRLAVEGKDFSYFSPEFLLNEDGTPGGLPSRGPLGSLVNNPAFRTIPRIAASDAAEDPKPNAHTTMSQLLILAACGLLNQNEAAREDAETLARQRVSAMRNDSETLRTVQASLTEVTTERDGLKTKLEAAESKLKEQAEKRAGDLVAAAVKDGRLLPKDEKGQGFYKRLIAAGDVDAEETLAALPKLNEGLDKAVVVTAGQDAPNGSVDHPFIAKAKRLVAAKEAEDIDSAMDLVIAADASLYDDYCESLHAD